MNCTIIRTTNRLKFEFKARPNATCNIQYIYIFKKKRKKNYLRNPTQIMKYQVETIVSIGRHRSVFKPGEKEHGRCAELEYALKPRNATFPLMKPCATPHRIHPRPLLGGKNARARLGECIRVHSNSKDSFAGSNQPS